MIKIETEQKTLHFKTPAGTSRGVFTEREVWYVKIYNVSCPSVYGVGECAPLPKLSCDDLPDYADKLSAFCKETERISTNDVVLPYNDLKDYPSILFGLEAAKWQYVRKGSIRLSDTGFANGYKGIPINGLVWMGAFEDMRQRLKEKIEEGFHCIKLKIGAIDFEKEIALIASIRQQFSSKHIEIRVDANGGFKPHDALEKLKRIAEYDVQSIEQPIMAGQWEDMSKLCKKSPLPIALDEELIGINDENLKKEMLDTISPQYIILKPSLHGGLTGSQEWIDLAKQRGIGWWATSAMESNIGLNAIAHWCALMTENKGETIPQGLGTGQLFTDNVPSPLFIKNGELWFDDSNNCQL